MIYSTHFETGIASGIQLDEGLKLDGIIVTQSGDLVVKVVNRCIMTRAAENTISLRGGISKTFKDL